MPTEQVPNRSQNDICNDDSPQGKLIAHLAAHIAERLVTRMRKNVHGSEARIIGMENEQLAGIVAKQTGFGGTRIVDMLVGEQFPRIC